MDEEHEEHDRLTSEEVTAHGIGGQLRAERERQGLTREDIGARTRIPERHLHSIESGDFDALPGRTYAVGFARTYARELGLDEDETAEAVRAEMGVSAPATASRSTQLMEPGDPARIPSARLAWGVAVLLVLAIIAGFFIWRSWFLPAGELPPLAAEEQAVETGSAPTATASPAAASGPVVFTATTQGVWVRFYDAGGERLYEGLMEEGESFTIPETAQNPQMWTGRPDAFAITVGGRRLAPLAEEDSVVRDVPVDARSLVSRPPGPGLPQSPG